MGLDISDFGSYYIGGSTIKVNEGAPANVNFTRDAAYTRDPRGHYIQGQAYVQYFCPRHRNAYPPVVLVHGGGMCGSTWETTPDGRLGWLHMLVANGYEVHVIDCVERGRAGFSTTAFDGAPIERSIEEAWHLFRFGKAEDFHAKIPFPSQQFPIHVLEYFARYLVPRWLSTSKLQVDALKQLLLKLEKSLLITHSQGGELGFDAAEQQPQTIAGIIAVEPSSLPKSLDSFKSFRTVLMQGDFLDKDERWSKRAEGWESLIRNLRDCDAEARIVDLPNEVGPGNSHMPMMDLNNEQCLKLALNKLHN